jgi:hypothetical protein
VVIVRDCNMARHFNKQQYQSRHLIRYQRELRKE